MRRFTRISRMFWISAGLLSFTACTNRAPSLRMLDTRAGYENGYDDEEVALYQRAKSHGDQIGRAMGPRIAKVYVYPHELPSQDYFWGGYISLIVHRDEIVFDPPEDPDSQETDLPKSAAHAPKKKAPAKMPAVTEGDQ